MGPIHTTYRTRLYPSRSTHGRMDEVSRMLNSIYNAALEERRAAWRLRREARGLYDQIAELTAIRAEMPEWEALAIEASRGVLRRVERAFQASHRRMGRGETPGFPRFKPLSRFRAIELEGVRDGMVNPNADRTRDWLSIKGLPRQRFGIKRPLPDGKLKGILITCKPTVWYLSLQHAVDREPLPELEGAVGVDMGVKKRLALSNGETIESRDFDRTQEEELRRRVSRAKKGSANRRKRVATVGRETYRNAVRNRNAYHRLTSDLARRFGVMTTEDLRIGNMTRSASGTMEGPGKGASGKLGLNLVRCWQSAVEAWRPQ